MSIDDAIADSISTMQTDNEPDYDNERASLIDEAYDVPDADIIGADRKRPAKAERYEAKVAGLFQFAYKATAENPRTVADSAAILMYGAEISEAAGDLAAQNPIAAKAIDFITDTTDNAALALMASTVPFVLQVLRNHEQESAPEAYREIRIPFTKRSIKLKFRIRLRGARKFTEEPDRLVAYVYSQPDVLAAVHAKQLRIPGVNV